MCFLTAPVSQMRFTNRPFQDTMCVNCVSINILSVKIACSDIDFSIQVYCTVIARDCIDYKCVYLFRRDNDHCQLISSNVRTYNFFLPSLIASFLLFQVAS
jgi:hypothetical protein